MLIGRGKIMHDFSREVWFNTYRYNKAGEDNIGDTFRRVANAVGVDEDQKESFFKILNEYMFCPGGRILSNAGTEFAGTTLFNCYVGPKPKHDQDSLEGIAEILLTQMQTLKSEGGWGMNFSFLRPRGALIKKIGVETPGSVKYMELYNKASDIITAGSGKEKTGEKNKKNRIRKGAMMGVLWCWHPDIEEFIEAKRTANRLDKFNISVGCSNEFMDAVRRVEETDVDENWNLVFPDTSFDKYATEWDGDIDRWKANGYPIIVYKSISVKYLWEKIMRSTYDFNDPGVLFLDRANETYLFNYSGNRIHSTNPCVAKGTLVNTPHGYKKVEDIKIGDYISTVLDWESVQNIETHKNVPVFKVTFSDGGSQIVTQGHRYHILRKGSLSKKVEKVQLKDVKIGDRVVITSAYIDFSENDEQEYKKGLKSGILLGDGSYTGEIKISSSTDDEDYNCCVKSLFGEDNFNKDYFATDGSKSMSLCLKKNVVDINNLGLTPQYSEEKTIDYSILNNKSVIIGLLDGLLATDGNVNLKSNHPQLRWFTTSPVLAQTIRDHLLYLGCHGFITNSFDEGGIINGRKIVRKNIKYTITISGESFRNYAKLTRIAMVHMKKYRSIVKALSEFKLSGNCWHATITNIEPYGVSDVYDLYCEESDTWITSGYTQQGCGEQNLPFGEVCDLGSLCLPFLLNDDYTDFDFKKVRFATRRAVEFLDRVNDISNTPCDEYSKNAKSKRRIGLGIMGWGSALYLLKKRFGSKEAENIKSDLMRCITLEAVDKSIELAILHGPYDGCDKDKLADHPFWQQIQLPANTINAIRKYGMRNSALFSIQPTGNTSILYEVVSGGCEPVFLHEYIRTTIVQSPPDYIKELCPKYWQGEFVETEMFKFSKEGDETILRGVDENGVVYKIDKNRGLTKEVFCEDYGVKILKERGEWDSGAEWAVTTNNLTVYDHITDLKGWAKWIDSSISKTINLPNNYPYDDFKRIYLEAYKSGVIKGITTYRDGTMTSVLSSIEKKDTIIKKRPKKLRCDIHHPTVKGSKYYVAIGLDDNDKPYEIFAGENGIDKDIASGFIQRIRNGRYSLIADNEVVIEDMGERCSNEEEAVARLASISLRNGVEIQSIVDQLEKTKGSLSGFAKVMCRILRKYIPESAKCNDHCPECKESLVYQEGCKKCVNCGFSKC